MTVGQSNTLEWSLGTRSTAITQPATPASSNHGMSAARTEPPVVGSTAYVPLSEVSATAAAAIWAVGNGARSELGGAVSSRVSPAGRAETTIRNSPWATSSSATPSTRVDPLSSR